MTIELYQAGKFCSEQRFLGITHVSLEHLVDGSTKQLATFQYELPGGKHTIVGRVNFRIRFEEILDIKVQLTNWQGIKLTKDCVVNQKDLSTCPYRHIVFRIGDNEPSRPILSANPEFPRWKDPVTIGFNGSSVNFKNSVLMAVVFASSNEFEPEVPIGYAAFPLISISEVPFVKAPIIREIMEESVDNKKTVVGIERVGTLQGYAYLVSDLSLYSQINAPRRQLRRHIYLSVSIDQISNLPDGLHDYFFVSIEWRQFVQNSKVFKAPFFFFCLFLLSFPVGG